MLAFYHVRQNIFELQGASDGQHNCPGLVVNKDQEVGIVDVVIIFEMISLKQLLTIIKLIYNSLQLLISNLVNVKKFS